MSFEELGDGELESLDSRVQDELIKRKRRVSWTDSQREALAHIARRTLGPNQNDVSFACNESNHLVLVTRLSGGGELFYYCMVVACSSSLGEPEA